MELAEEADGRADRWRDQRRSGPCGDACETTLTRELHDRQAQAKSKGSRSRTAECGTPKESTKRKKLVRSQLAPISILASMLLGSV